jgi:hypothetical protein
MNNFFQTTIPDWQNDDVTFGRTEPRGDNLWNGTGKVLQCLLEIRQFLFLSEILLSTSNIILSRHL